MLEVDSAEETIKQGKQDPDWGQGYSFKWCQGRAH